VSSSAAGCGTCARIAIRDAGDAPDWDAIVRTARWDLVHSYDTSLLGWLVLVPRRHIISVSELDVRESRELGDLLRFASGALEAEVGCAKTYVMQFAEHPDHPHVHFHVVPRAADLPDAHRGAGIFHYLGATDVQRVTGRDMNALALRLRRRYERFPDPEP